MNGDSGIKIMITINELFSGIGAQVAAFKRLNIPYKVIGISEIDKYAIQSYEAINGPTRNYGDITQIPMLDYADLWTYSSPCFTADSFVLTETLGYKKITNVVQGEKVLTHDGSYKTVEKIINNGIKPTVKIYGMGFDEIHTTENHKFYVREKSKVWNNLKRSYKRVFSKPIWKQAINLTRNDYLGFPINQKSIIPDWKGIIFKWSDGRSDRYKNQLSPYMNEYRFWWLIGRYVADGYVRNNGGIVITCGKKKITEFKKIGKELGINHYISEERTAFKFHYSLKELELFVKPFGKYAHGKKIPGFVLDLPVDLLKGFLNGYMAGDGCFTNNKFKATSTSRELVYGLTQCIAKIYKRPFAIYKTVRPKTTVIEGRIVNQRDTYTLTFSEEDRIQDKAFYENGFVWYPFNKLKKADDEFVYDLTVADNHSFIINNAIVHNCQDFSTAGKQKGIYNADGSLTRSGLLKHVERLLIESVLFGTQPKYLLMENVKGLVSKKFKPDFERWLQKLEQLGYKNYWKVLNAKDYGIPQNRERVFVVSIRKDIDDKGYKFPSPVPLEKRLKDVLEPYVDEKYYLSADKVAKLINESKTNLNEQTTAIISKQGTCLDKTTDVACTLMARDYKSFGNQGMNGVIEPFCTASRGRNPENPSDRTAGIPTEQTLEINYSGCTNTLTSVQKDNYIIEPSGVYLHDSEIFHKMPLPGVSRCLKAEKHDVGVVESKVIQVGNIVSTGDWNNPQRGRIYSSEGCSPTLNTCQGGGNHEPKILEEGYKNAKNKTIRTLLRVLWKEIREKKVWEQIRRFQCVSETEILRQGMYEKSFFKTRETTSNIFQRSYNSEKYKFFIIESNFLRDMWLSIKSRRSSQRWGLSEQQFREFTSFMQKLSFKTAQKKEKLCYMWETDESFRVLRKTLSEIQEIWKSINIEPQESYRIRKLTARECWRLMGFTDVEFDCAKFSGVSNSQLYKQAGNSIVVDVLVAIFKELFND